MSVSAGTIRRLYPRFRITRVVSRSAARSAVKYATGRATAVTTASRESRVCVRRCSASWRISLGVFIEDGSAARP